MRCICGTARQLSRQVRFELISNTGSQISFRVGFGPGCVAGDTQALSTNTEFSVGAQYGVDYGLGVAVAVYVPDCSCRLAPVGKTWATVSRVSSALSSATPTRALSRAKSSEVARPIHDPARVTTATSFLSLMHPPAAKTPSPLRIMAARGSKTHLLRAAPAVNLWR